MSNIKELLQRLTDIEELEHLDSDGLSEVAYWTGYLEALLEYTIELVSPPAGLGALLKEFKV